METSVKNRPNSRGSPHISFSSHADSFSQTMTAASRPPATIDAPAPVPAPATAAFRILAAVSVCHMLNDMVQSLLPSIYPILKSSFRLNFGQIGLLSLTYQLVASCFSR